MSIVNDKKRIVNEISVLNSIGKTAELPDLNFTYPSVSTKNEPIPFMLDLLTATIGSEALKRTTGQVMTKFIRNTEPDLKTNLKKQSITFNSNNTLPAGFVSGYSVPVKKIDLTGKLKNDPASQSGSLLYASAPNGFDKSAYNAMVNPGTDITFGNMIMNYNSSSDSMIVKPINSSQTIGTFVNEYIDNLKIIDEKEFTTQIMDTIYGTTAKSTKKSIDAIAEEERIRALIDKLIDNPDDPVSISDEEFDRILEIAKNKYNGIVPVDVGCSIIDSVLTLEDIEALIANNLTSNDPNSVGNAYNGAMENSFGRVPTQNNPASKNAIRDGFFKRLIKTISSAIVFALTSTPQIRVLMAMLNGFKNNDNVAFPKNSVDDINSQRNFIGCLSKSAGGLLNKFIFDLLKIELLKIVIPVTTILIKEKLQAFIRILESLFT